MSKPLKFTTDVKKQHTVPRFLLDNFGFGNKGRRRQLYTFDKLNTRQFQQSVFDATTRNTFYNLAEHPEKASLEPILGIYEGESAPLIQQIIEKRSIGWMSYEDRRKVATFIAVQRARSYGELQRIEHAMNALSGKFSSVGMTPEQIEQELGSEGSSDRKNMFLEMILDQNETISYLMDKSWILYETKEQDPFFISDNPITLHNDIKMGPYGNLGIALKGIQIHLPLSSTLTLALICPSISESIIEGKKLVEKLLVTQPILLKQLTRPFALIDVGKAYENGTSIAQSTENVKFLNSLQVMFSEQYLFCEKDHFHLVEEMISDNEKYKFGPRIKVN